MKITAKMLKDKGAYCGQLKIFSREWPEGCKVTVENGRRAAALELDILWVARNFLPYAKWLVYKRSFDVLVQEYYRQTFPLWEEYVQRRDKLLVYEPRCRVEDMLWADFQRQKIPFYSAFNLNAAQLFVDIVTKSGM